MEIPTIENPRLWRLSLLINGETMTAVLNSTVADASLFHFSIPLNPTLAPAKALEEAIYATPMLLADYARIDIFCSTESYTVVPAGLSKESAVISGELAHIAEPDVDCSTHIDDTATDARIVWAQSAQLTNFLGRTFRNVPLRAHISPLLHFFHSRAESGNGPKLFVHLTPNKIDVVAFDTGAHLLHCSTHTITGVNDAVYYILAIADRHGMLPDNADILLCGDALMRQNILPMLRRYTNSAMPMIFPSAALRAGRDAFSAPFPLIVAPLCE